MEIKIIIVKNYLVNFISKWSIKILRLFSVIIIKYYRYFFLIRLYYCLALSFFIKEGTISNASPTTP